jgi:hypothetical protein
MASAYQSPDATEIVIAYAGTTDEDGSDWRSGNVPAVTAAYFPEQVYEAARFYLDVRAAYPGVSSFSFTGHSLGGGLASLMAVFFDKTAHVFDEAPFLKSADSSAIVGELKSRLMQDYNLPIEFCNYQASADPTGAVLSSDARIERQKNVTNTFVVGEVLSVASEALKALFAIGVGLIHPTLLVAGWGVNKVVGKSIPIDPKAQSMLGWGPTMVPGVSGSPVDLHSMSLLAAFLLSTHFKETTQAHPELLPRLFSLYKNDPTAQNANFLDLLVQRQYRGEQALDISASDVDKIDITSGLTSETKLSGPGAWAPNIHVASVLVDAVLAGIYNQGQDRLPVQIGLGQFQSVLRTVVGGLQFDMDALGDQSIMVESKFKQLIAALLVNEAHRCPIDQAARWTVQSGTAALQVNGLDADLESDVALGYVGNDLISGGGGNDVLIGYAGNDTLQGGAWDDFLYGGDDDDTLDGGSGNDHLMGGTGVDKYTFIGTWGQDIIDDYGDGGSISVDGIVLTGSGTVKVGVNAYKDNNFRYAIADNGLVIQKIGASDSIIVRDWGPANDFGIVFNETPENPITSSTISGDFNKQVSGASYVSSSTGYINAGVASILQTLSMATPIQNVFQAWVAMMV